MLVWILLLSLAGAARATEAIAQSGRLIHSDSFARGLAQWVVEQQPGGTVTAEDGRLTITDKGGCTVWFRERLDAPVLIEYHVTMASSHRVSDLNCFWMATDPERPDDLFAPGHTRDGSFASYDSLRTYYAGCGGNTNTTTRFRRYDGTGNRPLLPEHDLSAPEFMLTPDHTYRIALVALDDGRVQFYRDGVLVFDFVDPEPLKSGWFGLRTVKSRMVVSDFSVTALEPFPAGAR